MSERYIRLFNLTENLYSMGAPVLIAAGALLKDNQTGGILAQLKLKNIGTKTIKAAKVALQPLDAMNRPLAGIVVHDYLDLSIQRGQEFGQKEPIRLPDATTRAYSVKVTEVGFSDNSIWTDDKSDWKPLEVQEPLAAFCKDSELEKQFRIEFGEAAKYLPRTDRDLWLCFCGAVNHKEETACHICGKDQHYDLAALKKNCEKRLELEAAEDERRAAEEAAAQAEREAKAKKTKRLLAIMIPSAIAVIAVILILTLVVIPKKRYNDALAESYEQGLMYLNGENYQEAIDTFAALGSYRDSEQRTAEAREKKQEADYNVACILMNEGEYQRAVDAFSALGDYRDSTEKMQIAREAKKEEENNTNYQNAIKLMNDGKYGDAYQEFAALGDYSDSKNKQTECIVLCLKPFQAYAGKYKTTDSSYGDTYYMTISFYVDTKDNFTICAEGNNGSYIQKYQDMSGCKWDENNSRFFWKKSDGTVYYYLESGSIRQTWYNNKYHEEYPNYLWTRVS